MNVNIINEIDNFNREYIIQNEPKIKKSGENFSKVEYFGRLLLLNYFNSLGFLKNVGETLGIESIKNKIGLIPKYNKLFDVLLDILKTENFIAVHEDTITATDKVISDEIKNDLENLERFKSELINKYNDMQPHFNLLEICISNYGVMLNGTRDASQIMFPLFSIDIVKKIFAENILVDYFNEVIANIIHSNIDKKGKNKVRILEIGAGSGGTSRFVLNKIKNYSDILEFFFTDISKVFLKKAKKLYENDFPFIEFKKLDIGLSPEEQGFKAESFDIIFASNVIHSTESINKSLSNVYKLLMKDGIFLLNEVTDSQDFVNLTFGLMDGWWKFKDSDIRINNSPLLTAENWLKALHKNNFKNAEVVTTTHQEIKDSFSQSLFVSVK